MAAPTHFWMVFYRWQDADLDLHFEHEIPRGDALEATVSHRFKEGWHGAIWHFEPLPSEEEIRAGVAAKGSLLEALPHCACAFNHTIKVHVVPKGGSGGGEDLARGLPVDPDEADRQVRWRT